MKNNLESGARVGCNDEKQAQHDATDGCDSRRARHPKTGVEGDQTASQCAEKTRMQKAAECPHGAVSRHQWYAVPEKGIEQVIPRESLQEYDADVWYQRYDEYF